MEVMALVSGGKDSCFAMIRCLDYGHKVVALANLIPLDAVGDELDSYMYQTVGHQIVVSYAKCMGLPRFRRRIRGSTRDQGLKYNVTPGDEVEDMFALLREVKRQIPLSVRYPQAPLLLITRGFGWRVSARGWAWSRWGSCRSRIRLCSLKK